jgi:PAS domain S-box-containing protein
MFADKNMDKHTKTRLIVSVTTIALCLLGGGVLVVWHNPSVAGAHQSMIMQMSHNTALCMLLSSLALFSLLIRQFLLLKICALFMGIIGGLKLLELLTGFTLHVDYWFITQAKISEFKGAVMAPASAVCVALTSLSLMLFKGDGKRAISIVFLNLINLVITFIALLSQGIGILPAFVWLGIRMAPHTAIGFSLFSITLIIYLHRYAVDAFNQLNFFKRIAAGFAFMAILVTAIGSIAVMQIHTVSALAHELYEKPLKTANAAQRIRTDIDSLNRQLKNVAIQKAVEEFQDIPSILSKNETRFSDNIISMRTSDPSLKELLDQLESEFKGWSQFTRDSWRLLEKGEFEIYASRTVYDGQQYVIAMDEKLANISDQAQQNIIGINRSVASIEEEAKKLVVVFVIGFLLAGLVVASLITRSLNSQLQKLRQAMTAIASEKNAPIIPFLHHPEEIGEMARTLQVFQESLLARRDLETRLLQVVEAMPNGIIMINSDGIMEIVNIQAEKIFGYDRSELLNQKIEKLIPPEVAKEHSQNRNSFFAHPSPRQMGAGRELFGLRRDGSEFPLEIGLAPVNTKSGMKVLASIVDITERRKAELALNESREKLELTTRVNQIGIWEYIPAEGKLIWNDAMFEIYGRKKNYFTADYQAWKQNIHPSDLEHTERQLQDAIQNLTSFNCKYRIIQPDGTIKHLHAKAEIEDKGQLRMLGTCMDVTREELALAKIHDLEVLRSAIVESSEDAIISKTPTGIVTSWNLGAQNMFGFSAKEAIGRSIKDLVFPPELLQEEETLLAQVRTGAVVKHLETKRQCKDNRIIDVSITLSPIKDADGNITGISAIKRDITESIKTANILAARTLELEHSNQELARSNKELETFAYVASHDLKSPLRGIAQLSAWIEEDLASNETDSVVEHTHLLRNRIQRMEKLLDDLLVFYRAGKAEGQIVPVDVNQMVREVFEIQNNKPGLRLEIAASLPSFSTLSTPFELIIRNLFSNAIKHHDKDEGVISVSAKILNKEYFEFSVSDDGPGIPEKFHQRVFGMFQTLKPRDELEGSGMGLALIKKIVESYGGYVTLESIGRGTRFSFSWPQHIRRRTEND